VKNQPKITTILTLQKHELLNKTLFVRRRIFGTRVVCCDLLEHDATPAEGIIPTSNFFTRSWAQLQGGSRMVEQHFPGRNHSDVLETQYVTVWQYDSKDSIWIFEAYE